MDEKELIAAVKLHLIGNGEWTEKQKETHLEILRKKRKEGSFLFQIIGNYWFSLFFDVSNKLKCFFPFDKDV